MPVNKRPLSEWLSDAISAIPPAVAFRVTVGDGPRDHDPVALFGWERVKKESAVAFQAVLPTIPPDELARLIERKAADAGWPDELATIRVVALDAEGKQIGSFARTERVPDDDRDDDDDEPRKGKRGPAPTNRYDFGAAAMEVVKNSNNALIEMVKAASGHSVAQSNVIGTLSAELGKSLEAQRAGVDEVGEARAAAFDSMLSNTLAGFAGEVEQNGNDPAWQRAWSTFEGFVARLLGMADGGALPGGGLPRTPDEWKDFAKKNSAAFRAALTDPATVEAIRSGMDGGAPDTGGAT